MVDIEVGAARGYGAEAGIRKLRIRQGRRDKIQQTEEEDEPAGRAMAGHRHCEVDGFSQGGPGRLILSLPTPGTNVACREGFDV